MKTAYRHRNRHKDSPPDLGGLLSFYGSERSGTAAGAAFQGRAGRRGYRPEETRSQGLTERRSGTKKIPNSIKTEFSPGGAHRCCRGSIQKYIIINGRTQAGAGRILAGISFPVLERDGRSHGAKGAKSGFEGRKNSPVPVFVPVSE